MVYNLLQYLKHSEFKFWLAWSVSMALGIYLLNNCARLTMLV